jgi:ribosomal protein L2
MIEYQNNAPVVLGKIASMTDVMMGLMAANIEIQIKISGNTPVRHGNLRNSARSIKTGRNNYMVVDNANYAAAQEIGHRHTKAGVLVEFVNHPNGGGAGYFRKAIDATLIRSNEFATTASRAVGLGDGL